VAERLVAAAQDPFQARPHGGGDVRLPESARTVDLDPIRRAAGATQQTRDADVRLDAGLVAARPAGEESADSVAGFGASIPVEPGGFLAELVRADSMLHIADQSIEQIDLNLDYMHELTEEAASGLGRDPAVLDDLFQVVKADVIDSLAQTTEAQGEKILAGGTGPDGDYVIRMTGGDAPEIAIPSMRLGDLAPDLTQAGIRTRDAAIVAMPLVDFASDDALQAREEIAEQRALLRQMISREITRNGASRPMG
jgi:hypothetical protein